MLEINAIPRIAWLASICLVTSIAAFSGEKSLIQLRDFTQSELKSGGFSLSTETKIHLRGLGAGTERRIAFSTSDLFAYGWIINAGSREEVWRMGRGNTKKQGRDRKFDGEITLPRGDYELYFAAYAYTGGSTFTNFDMNVDPRRHADGDRKNKRRGFLDWFEDLFGENVEKEWTHRAKDWGIELFVNEANSDVKFFAAPKEFPYTLFKAIRLGENEHVRQQFVLAKPMSLRIYAMGEQASSRDLVDYGWIVNAKSHKRLWEMARTMTHHAGGADKNVKFDDVVSLPAGEYSLYYVTDDSHSYVDWNAAPPDDPLNYGISLIAVNETDKGSFKLTSKPNEDRNVIVQLVPIGSDETRTVTFSLKEEARLRIYALGEASNSRNKMADYGWIINTRTREKVWTMDLDHTEHAGGTERNRMVDEVIALPKGDYTVVYQTDGSHAYDDWNSAPPYDPEHWGITVYGEGEDFNMKKVEISPSARRTGVIAQIVQVGNSVNRTQNFRLSGPLRIRIYAIGEGQNKEMFDYGWIENASTRAVVWEMTYSMTFHAGGGRKNRVVNTTMMLDKGDYTLHYVSDDSHSYNDWNTDPPDDTTMWGITVYEETE